MADQPIRQYPDELRERAEADTDAIANPALSSGPPCIPDHGAAVYCPGCAHDEEIEPAPDQVATEATEPATITDPTWLRQQYAAALRTRLAKVHAPGSHLEPEAVVDYIGCTEYDLADAVLAVRDRHLQQLRQRLALADADLDRYEEHVVGDLNEANIGLARQAARAEQQRNQLAADLQYVLDYRGPRHAHKQPGVWDTSGKPCDHCARLEQARQHLTNLTPTGA